MIYYGFKMNFFGKTFCRKETFSRTKKPFVVRQPTDTKAFSLFNPNLKENAQKYCVCFGV